MAQQDTGLGWSAKSEYLKESSGLLATIGGMYSTLSGFENQPLPYDTFPSDAGEVAALTQAKGLLIGADTGISQPHRIYALASESFCYIYKRGGLVGGYVGVSPSDTAKMCIIYVTSGGSIQRSIVFDINTSTTTTSGDTVYYRKPTFNFNVNTYYIYVTATSDDTAELASFYTSNADIYKDNAGYSVACVAKWKTAADVVMQSPILISTDSDFTNMSTSGTYQFAKYRTRRDGRTFYMSFYQDLSGALTSLLPVYDISGPEEPYANLDELFNLICAPDQANVLVTESVDPYEDFPPTGEDAGEVDPDPEDDDIEEEDLPTMSFATAGFCRIYRPDFSQVSALARYLWTDQTFLQTVINHLKQIIENPIDAIISLSIVPCVPPVLADDEVKVMFVPTGVSMPPIQRQFVSVDCGSYKLNEMYGSALDYNPYTSVQLYLPYIGVVQLDTDEVMGKTISIGYRIDVVTGVCCAYVKANDDVLYQFSGHCSIHQPITSADFSGYINAALAAGKLVASVAAAGAGAPAVAATLAGAPTPSISGTESKTVETERNPNTGRQITVGTRKRESQTYNPGASFGEVATRGVSNTVGAVMNSKTIIQHSGGFSGNSGFMAAVRRPYLIVTRPRIANPENYGKYNGRPSMIYLNLGDCTGFTQVQSIQLTGIDATNPELSEIATLLNSGVIL